MACQKPNGLVTLNGPTGPTITRDVSYELGVTAAVSVALPLKVPSAWSVPAVLLMSSCDPAVAAYVPLTETVEAET